VTVTQAAGWQIDSARARRSPTKAVSNGLPSRMPSPGSPNDQAVTSIAFVTPAVTTICAGVVVMIG
jgi:hypothetical protein